MSEFTRVASVKEIPDPGKRLFEVDDRMVVLFHIGGRFYCIDDVCTHDGGPLADGRLNGHEIACPRHGARFDVRNGKAVSMPATENTIVHEVRIEGGDVFVRIHDD